MKQQLTEVKSEPTSVNFKIPEIDVRMNDEEGYIQDKNKKTNCLTKEEELKGIILGYMGFLKEQRGRL